MRNLNLLYDYALQFVGVPYLWGGANPMSGLDCSGLIQEILSAVDMDPPGDQTAQSLYDYFRGKKGTRLATLGLGALAFYGVDTDEISHVVLMLDAESCIGANGGGSSTIDLASAKKHNAFVKIRPLHYRKDLVAVLMPEY